MSKNKKAKKQRAERGWADCDTWNLDTYISQVLGEALIHLRDHTQGYPSNITEEEWSDILTRMASGFTRWADHFDDPDEQDAYRQVRASIRLMHRWFGHLWD